MSNSGKFIVVEGPEGSGKSTQCQRLVVKLQNLHRDALLTIEPGGTGFGQEVRRLLFDPRYNLSAKTELFLFSADRAHHCEEVIAPALLSGKDVVTDRYKFSTFAYQCYAGSLPLEEAEAVTEIATCCLEPDLLILLDGDPAELFKRKARDKLDRIELKDLEYHQRVRDGFLKLYEQHAGRKAKINALHTVAEIERQILYEACSLLGLY